MEKTQVKHFCGHSLTDWLVGPLTFQKISDLFSLLAMSGMLITDCHLTIFVGKHTPPTYDATIVLFTPHARECDTDLAVHKRSLELPGRSRSKLL